MGKYGLVERKTRHYSRWSSEELDYLRMFGEDPDGDTCITVANYLGRSPSAVRTMIHKLRQEGVQTKLLNKWTDFEIERLIYMDGKVTVKEQAELLRRSYNSVANKRTELNLGTRRVDSPAGKGKEIRELAHQGLYRKEIAKKLGLNYFSLCKYIKSQGIPCLKDEEGIENGKKRHYHIMACVFYKEK